jgi:tetratricopeptide (TPR) repeat protein
MGDALLGVESHVATCGACRDLLAAAATRAQQSTVPLHPQGRPELRDPQLTRGDQVGRYTVLASIGRGGMGEVYAAYDPELDRRVALKLIRAGTGHPAHQAQARLLGEAKAMARLSHPNVVPVHDAGAFEGRVFLAMKFVDGLTLTGWLAERTRSRQEILSLFLGAARGLAAAHDAGLVHRDFKPDNVMVGRDGTIQVTDFGLARSFAECAPREQRAPALDGDLRLTAPGDVVGTPYFMAPEQFAGGPVDARTDQFSFCVALYHALYGVRPFNADAVDALSARVRAGGVEPAPPKTTVPIWIRRILIRGLAVDSSSRWATMHELVAALETDPVRARRRLSLSAGLVALVGAAALGLARGPTERAPLCLGGPARLAGSWEGAQASGDDQSRRNTIEKAFAATRVPGAREVWTRVEALLDRYRDGWLAMYREACEATNVHHEQSPAILDLRMACLDQRRLALSALTGVLATADDGTVKSAVDAANALPPLAFCADTNDLEAAVEPPPDERTRRRVEELRARAATTKAINDTGKHEEAMGLARRDLADARDLGYRPLVAEMLVALTRTSSIGTNFRAPLVPITEEALWTALAIGRDDLAAEAAIQLVGEFGYFLDRPGEGEAWAKLAGALLQRAPGKSNDLLLAWLLSNESMIAFKLTAFERMLDLTRQALALKSKVLPPDHPDIAGSLINEAEVLAKLGRTEEALSVNQRAADILTRAYGRDSGELYLCLSNRCAYLVTLGRPAEALEVVRPALSGWERQLGANHPFLGMPLTAMGRALTALARSKEALATLDRALRIREASEPDAALVAETRFAFAEAIWQAGVDRLRAREVARVAREGYAGAKDEKKVAEIDAWLALHTAR